MIALGFGGPDPNVKLQVGRPTSPPTAIGLTSGVGTFVVTGGSGRFENARGNGSYTVQAQLFPRGSDPAASVQPTFEGILRAEYDRQTTILPGE